jgi:hypothetical protein
MADRIEEDVVMLDDWEPEKEGEDGKQMSGIHGERILTNSFRTLLRFPATPSDEDWVEWRISGRQTSSESRG